MFPLKSIGTICDLNHWIKLRLNPDHYNSEKQGEVNWRLDYVLSQSPGLCLYATSSNKAHINHNTMALVGAWGRSVWANNGVLKEKY
ncbi:hypothetical protein Hanom_Chr15g01360161 [Helianthus anomalus]